MDAIDRRLLDLLRADASLPLKTLGAEVALSRSSVRDRIARMARTPDLVVVRAVAAMPEVTRCDALSGEIDLLVEVAAADGPALNAVRDRIAALPGVLEVTTSLVLAGYMPRR
jgi:DNA-binding Lrp family transcriptional regulator